jgi:hypothetical protein
MRKIGLAAVTFTAMLAVCSFASLRAQTNVPPPVHHIGDYWRGGIIIWMSQTAGINGQYMIMDSVDKLPGCLYAMANSPGCTFAQAQQIAANCGYGSDWGLPDATGIPATSHNGLLKLHNYVITPGVNLYGLQTTTEYWSYSVLASTPTKAYEGELSNNAQSNVLRTSIARVRLVRTGTFPN